MIINHVQSFAKKAKDAVLDKLCEQIILSKANNNGKIPYGLTAKIVKETKSVCPWLTRDHILNRMRSQDKKASSICTAIIPFETNVAVAAASSICTAIIPVETNIVVAAGDELDFLGGRPLGTTNQKRKLDQMALIATRNEISLQYENEKKEAVRLKKRLKKGRLSEFNQNGKNKK